MANTNAVPVSLWSAEDVAAWLEKSFGLGSCRAKVLEKVCQRFILITSHFCLQGS
jgi:hypothetical protein